MPIDSSNDTIKTITIINSHKVDTNAFVFNYVHMILRKSTKWKMFFFFFWINVVEIRLFENHQCMRFSWKQTRSILHLKPRLFHSFIFYIYVYRLNWNMSWNWKKSLLLHNNNTRRYGNVALIDDATTHTRIVHADAFYPDANRIHRFIKIVLFLPCRNYIRFIDDKLSSVTVIMSSFPFNTIKNLWAKK